MIGFVGCVDEPLGQDSASTETGDGDGDGDGEPGDGDGEPGDGDGEPGDGDGEPGDGDGEPGDGDGDGDVCGDMIIGASEDCEADDLAGSSCVDLGYLGGELACGVDCSFDTSACVDSLCGDGMKSGDEGCDMTDFGGDTCETLGHTGGELACGDDCATNESGCYDTICGNDTMEDAEECDGVDVGGMTCADSGFTAGELGCSDDCELDFGMCSSCGNNILEGPEVCDGNDIGNETCQSQGWLAGELGCSMDCGSFDESGCQVGWWGDDFEGGPSLGDEWILTGDADWFASTTMPHQGTYAAECGDIGDFGESYLTITLNFEMNGSITFWQRVSTEADYDYLYFYIDDFEQASWAGEQPWTEETFPVGQGLHTLSWWYLKDPGASENDDTVWIDDVTTVGGVLP